MSHCLWAVFVSVLFLPQFLALSAFSDGINNATAKPGIHSASQQIRPYFSASLPVEFADTAMEVEAETTEEDDTQNYQDDFFSKLAQKRVAEELLYTCFLRSRYLQLISSAHRQPAVPFFILYHSWKNYLV